MDRKSNYRQRYNKYSLGIDLDIRYKKIGQKIKQAEGISNYIKRCLDDYENKDKVMKISTENMVLIYELIEFYLQNTNDLNNEYLKDIDILKNIILQKLNQIFDK
jgi:hypothetical protein